ncbi:MAG: aminodeoxychorismate synthase component I [Candidatus Omnitrophota bacterium]
MKPIIEKISLSMTPFEMYSHFSDCPDSFFLDSGMDPDRLGRFSFMGVEPFLVFKSRGRDIDVDLQGWRKLFSGNPFCVLRDLLSKYQSDFRTDDFPFWGGAVGWFSYDLKQFTEKLPDTASEDTDIPECMLGFYDTVLIFDNLAQRAFIASTGYPETGQKRALRARARLASLKDRVLSIDRYESGSRAGAEPVRCRALTSNFSREEYCRAIRGAKRYITKGDIYQVNLSQRFSAVTESDPFRIYAALRKINPAPFAAYLNFRDAQVISASPERYIRVFGRKIETRPIKGTRPRGATSVEDKRLKRELVSSVKDRAENLMIVDLERNDLGRICGYGSVKVSEFMTCEEFPTVFHLTSTIEGKLRKGVGPVDILLNCFPGGSITGAPKIRAMEIIEELEGVKRSVYTGAAGYISFNGDMDTSVIIRTLLHRRGKLYFSVGGGIVHDSNPSKEYEETLHKARALIQAIGYSEQGGVFTAVPAEVRG